MIVVDYEMGNLGSILNILKRAGAKASLSKCPEDILKAQRLILPGVGAFDNAMSNLRRLNYLDALNQKVLVEKIPVLGICLGMQLLTQKSEEGQKPGLGWIDAQTVKFSFDNDSGQRKIPHMGWNNVRVCKQTPLFPDPEQEQRFYFVHSYYVQCNNTSDILTCTDYGIEFTSAVCRGNILGVQFHPEKSHRFGLEFFKAFLSWMPGMEL